MEKVRKQHERKNVIECLVTSLHLVQARIVKTCPNKAIKKKYLFVNYARVNYPPFQPEKVLHFTFPLKICMFLRELGNETYTFYHLYTSI